MQPPEYAPGTVLVVTTYNGLHRIPRFFRIHSAIHTTHFYRADELAFVENRIESDVDSFATIRAPLLPLTPLRRCILRWYARFNAYCDQPPALTLHSEVYNEDDWHLYDF